MPLQDLSEPARVDLKMVAGDSFSKEFRLREQDGTAIDLTGLTGRAQVRDRPGGELLAEFTVGPLDATGVVTISLTTAQTRALPGKGVWDLELDGGATNTKTIVQGDVKVIPDITVAP